MQTTDNGAVAPIYGVTGTKTPQRGDVHLLLAVANSLPPDATVVTGACVGVDALFARCAKRVGLKVHTVVPADRSRVDPQWFDWCDSFEEMPEGTDYRARNERVVALITAALMGFPSQAEDHPGMRRSGTWMTIRLAKRAGVPTQTYVLAEHR